MLRCVICWACAEKHSCFVHELISGPCCSGRHATARVCGATTVRRRDQRRWPRGRRVDGRPCNERQLPAGPSSHTTNGSMGGAPHYPIFTRQTHHTTTLTPQWDNTPRRHNREYLMSCTNAIRTWHREFTRLLAYCLLFV